MSRVKEDNDSHALALLGKKQVLKRRFGFWSLLGFAVCELITWETVLALFSEGFTNGGPAGLVYGFIIAWASTLSVYTVISELASMAPIAAGQYYWVYMLAPPRWKVFSSYIVGWLTSLAWVATVAIETIFAGTMIQGAIVLDNEDSYTPKRWQGMLLAWMVIAVAIFVNVIIPGALPKFEIFIIVFHIAGFVAILATLWATAPINSAHFVFTTSLNEGGWSSQGLSYCLGFMGNVATFVGADCSVHMAEEVENAALNIPRAIVTSMCINGLVGFAMMLTVLFCLGDVDTVLESATGYPFIQVFKGRSIYLHQARS
jgi:choline transport protein